MTVHWFIKQRLASNDWVDCVRWRCYSGLRKSKVQCKWWRWRCVFKGFLFICPVRVKCLFVSDCSYFNMGNFTFSQLFANLASSGEKKEKNFKDPIQFSSWNLFLKKKIITEVFLLLVCWFWLNYFKSQVGPPAGPRGAKISVWHSPTGSGHLQELNAHKTFPWNKGKSSLYYTISPSHYIWLSLFLKPCFSYLELSSSAYSCQHILYILYISLSQLHP